MALNLNAIKDILIQELSKNPAYYNLPPATKIVLDQAIETAASTSSVNILKQVQSFSNSAITNNSKTIIGPNNQYNITTSNLSSNDLKNRLIPNANSQLLGGLANDLTFTLLNDLNNKLPPNLRGVIPIEAVISQLSNVANLAVTKGIGASVGQVSTNILSGNFNVKSIVGDLKNLFTSNPTGALSEVNKTFDTSTTNKALNEARNFDVNNASNREKLITQTTGFIDPNAQYPTKDYQGQPDTNKLARGEVNGTVVQQKEKERSKGIQLPNGQSFEEPHIPYKAQYPYNKVTETESGHIIEIDDTEGAERIHVYHKSGTYVEIDSNGSVVRKTKGSSYEIIDKNGYISVTGDASVSVKGSVKIYVGGDADIEVEGDVNLKSFNDITMQAAGRVDISATEEINFHSANINIEADVNLNMKGDINAFLTTKDYYVKANNNSYHETLQNAYMKTGASIFNQAGSQIHNKSGDTFNVDGSAVYLNSGTSSASLPSKLSNSANIGMIGERKTVVYTEIPDPGSPNYLDAEGLQGEDSLNADDTNAQRQRLKNKGVTSADDDNFTGIAIDSDNPKSPNPAFILPDQSLLKVTSLPDNYQLSKHFTLASLSSKAVVSKYPVEAQSGLTYGQIVYNLAAVALNILEPALALFPNLMVTSGFRTVGASNPNSQHTKGQAADIQIRGISKNDYFEVAKKLANNLNYDQCLLEYKTTGTGMPWIHISINVSGQRSQVLTLLNDKKYSAGLTKLA